MRERQPVLFVLRDRWLSPAQYASLRCPCGRYSVLVLPERWEARVPPPEAFLCDVVAWLAAPSPWVIAHLVRCLTRTLGVGVILGLADLTAIVPASQLRGVCVNLVDPETRLLELRELARRWRQELKRIRAQEN